MTQGNPIKFRGLDHVVLRIIDLDAMMHFYCDILGCSVERRSDEIGLIQLRAGNALIDLVPVSGRLGMAGGPAPGRAGHNLDHFCLRLEDFDAELLRDWLVRNDIVVGDVEQRYGAEGDGPSLYIDDPEGNTVELKGPPNA
ncbi:MAG: VOC family protein [Pseudomonadales bacterium]|nr:VOC family protein [Pseudomonadales bacterium]